ncbi:MAG TPA: toxin HipA, partial [Firmicutes bacterium]|nr:toxin HipA [Bacillota bacterium]
GDEWIVKFRERNDPCWMGRMEYEYNLAAKECGIAIPEVRLLPSNTSDGYFASKRFDRNGQKRVHMLSLSGLLEVPHDLPLLDYVSFLQATGFISQSQKEVEKAFRLACFNVLSKNYDDHSKNFAFLYLEEEKRYVLSPAYDLTRTINQKAHEMSCNGEGLPSEKDLLEVAKKVGIPIAKAEKTLFSTKNIVEKRLGEWIKK